MVVPATCRFWVVSVAGMDSGVSGERSRAAAGRGRRRDPAAWLAKQGKIAAKTGRVLDACRPAIIGSAFGQMTLPGCRVPL